MKETQLQRIYNYPIYPRDSKIFSDKGFVNIDNGSQGGSHWCIFIKKKIISHFTLIVSAELQTKFNSIKYLNQKSIINLKYKI